jgi:hypothetical protein
VAVFADTLDHLQRLDFQILRDGGISFYRAEAVLVEDLAWFAAQGYSVTRFDCASWTTLMQMHAELQAHLEFPTYYGRNLDALNDCLSDLKISDAGGRVVVFGRLDIFVSRGDAFRMAAEGVLDVFIVASRRAMLFGRRLIVLIQSEDRNLSFAPLGGCTAIWNRREWMR